MWPFRRNGPSGFSCYSTAEEVTQGIDGSGLTAIVTGASSGIGAETARILAKRGVHVIMAVIDIPSATEVKQKILKEVPGAKVEILELDLSSFASVRQFAVKFESLNLPLNILINNAGIFAPPFSLSHDGIELQFATNHLGHFLLTNLLSENMKSTATKSNKEGRIVIVSSDGHIVAYQEGIRFDKINDKSTYNALWAYGQSKLANILHAVELSRRFKEQGVNITVNSLHPGLVRTNIFKYHSVVEFLAKGIGNLVMKNVQQGAATTCYVALNPQVSGVSGKYFIDCNIGKGNSKATDKELAKNLWEFSMNIIGGEETI